MRHFARIKSYRVKFILLSAFVTLIVISLQIFLSRSIVINVITEQRYEMFDDNVMLTAQLVNLRMRQADVLINNIKDEQRIKNHIVDTLYNGQAYNLSTTYITREILSMGNLQLADNVYIYLDGYKPIHGYYDEVIEETSGRIQSYLDTESRILMNDIIWEVCREEPYCLQATTYIVNNGVPIGVLVVNFDEDLFSDLFGGEKGNNLSYFYIVDSSNKVIYSKNKSHLGLSAFTIAKDNDLVELQDVGLFDWKMFGIMPYSEIEAEIKPINNIMTVISFVLLMVMLILPISIMRSVLTPVSKVIQGIEEVQKGNLNYFVEYSTKYEFRTLIDNFNYMVKRIKELIATVVEKQQNYRKVEIRALHSKLNPHFLYNTLDMIHWMLILKDEDEVSEVVVTLADILRYSVSNEDDFVTIRDDIRQIERYLSIQKLRFGDKLSYEITIASDVENCKIPKLLIQPIVEDAIKYAFVEMKNKGSIKIDVRLYGNDFIYFEISDNGVGMSSEKLKMVKAGLEDTVKSSGFGLSLVLSTVKSIYGEECGLDIKSTEGEGSTFTVKIKKTSTGTVGL